MATPAQSGFSKEELVAKLKQGPAIWNAWWSTVDSEVRRKIGLSGCDLSFCNLRGALLRDINFEESNFFETELREADLRGADLSKAKGCLLAKQFAGTDLTGATLPKPIADAYDKLGSVSEISDSAKKLFLALLAGCLYSWLTIATTKDVELITNRASSPLPIIQTAIPIVGFYVVAPVILLCIYFYFHFYLQKLWEELATLPAVFPDGRPLYARADPWLFNDLVSAHFVRLKKERPFLSYFQQWISILLAWWIVPITLLLFWGRYLPRHDTPWTIVLAVLLAISIVSAIQLYRLAKETLAGCQRTAFTWKEAVKRRRTYLDIWRLVVSAVALISISLGAIYGDPVVNSTAANQYRSPRTWIPWLIGRTGYSPFANLTDADISTRPPEWSASIDDTSDKLERVKGGDLRSDNLRFMLANHVFMAKTQLQHAKLQNADLFGADLRSAKLDEADLTDAILQHASLKSASMEYARLDNADLTQAQLSRVNLRRASMNEVLLTGADMTGADLTNANLHHATLALADLTGAILAHASIKHADLRVTKGLTKEMVQQAADWQMALYDDNLLKQLGLSPDHNQNVDEEMNTEEKQSPKKPARAKKK